MTASIAVQLVQILVPHPGAAREVPVWAAEEGAIDFRRDPARGGRCTTAFAAMELKKHLERTVPGVRVVVAESATDAGPAGTLVIELVLADAAGKSDGFSLAPCPGGVRITGEGRCGLVFGVYEFLRRQGWRWLSPGAAGVCPPEPRTTLDIPGQPQRFQPSFDQGRGFYFEYLSEESLDLLLWMARNRLNFGWVRPHTQGWVEKLGLTACVGGHIFEAILDPGRPLPNGRTLWETHPEWYGQPATGERTRERALATQFCVSRPELLDFLAGELLERLNREWAAADVADVWMFDTWGVTCQCDDCRRLGNAADAMLHCAAALRRAIDAARRAGTLDHDVRMNLCAYEGTATLQGPSRPVPPELLTGGDLVTYYPIQRCYRDRFFDPACAVNRGYAEALASWTRAGLPMMIGEYYNVSKFEDLPLLFTETLRRDLPEYRRAGCRAATYMHVPVVHWGLRALTQLLYAQLTWDVETDVDAFLDDYFARRYAGHAPVLREVYRRLEEAWREVTQWRAWAPWSVLSCLQRWDGRPPRDELAVHEHFGTAAVAADAGRRSAGRHQEALALLDVAIAGDRERMARSAGAIQVAANPVEAMKLEQRGSIMTRLLETRRLIVYGLETVNLMAGLAAYYDALRCGDEPAATAAWAAAEHAAAALEGLLIPISYSFPHAGFEIRDGLQRTQLGPCLDRCRAHRLPAPVL